MIKCDANKLPDCVKDKAREYAAKRSPCLRKLTNDDVADAWLNGFATCQVILCIA